MSAFLLQHARKSTKQVLKIVAFFKNPILKLLMLSVLLKCFPFRIIKNCSIFFKKDSLKLCSKMSPKKKILVIGGGFSGIGCIKCLKREGHEPVCYEKTSRPGGTWNYREDAPIGCPSIMPTTVINHSKEMGAMSDFPPDKKYPNFMRHFELYKLFTEIGERFDCFRHILYNREVIKVRRSADYDETGKWDATIKNTETGEISEESFDGVVVGVGQFTYPKMPNYKSMENYIGTIKHTHALKGVEDYRDKNVLVVGVGCSGMDAAVEISNVASQVYLSTRSGTWVLPRVGPYGLPFDYSVLRRYITFLQYLFGHKFISWLLESSQLQVKFNPNLYNLRPTYRSMSKDPVTNDLLPAKIISGSVVVRRDVQSFTERGVIFENESQETKVDAVIMATGYDWGFPFLEEDIVRVKDGVINLYKCVFPPHLKHATLAIVGFILPLGPGFPLGEMQCRWVAQIFSGNCKLPSKEVMMQSIKKRHKENSERYAPSEKMSIKVDYITYADELAAEMGAKPNLWKLFFTDPTLFRALMFGPSLPYQYRLSGPHKWEGARKAILTSIERVRYPLCGEYKSSPKPKFTTALCIKYFSILLLVAFSIWKGQDSFKGYSLLLMIPYLTSWKGFFKKYFFSLLLLPFFVEWDGFVSSYLVTIFFPILLAIFASI